MKKQIVLSCFLICSVFLINAQNVNRIQRGQRGYVPPPKYSMSTFIELKDPVEHTNRVVSMCTEAFGLDDFEREILKSMVYDNVESENAILSDEGNTRETRKQKVIALNNQFLKDLSNILSEEEINQYKMMDFEEPLEENNKRKKEKKRKKKKDKS